MSKETSLVPSNDELHVYQIMAKKATESQFFSKIGGESGLLSIMLMARELGLPAMQSVMGGMNIIQGKVELSPRLMNSMIRKAGHKIEILECSDIKCTLKGSRNDTSETYSCSFTIEDARKAGLVRSGGGWEKWASDMLFARCLSRLARRLFADVISTAYVEGEITDPEAHGPIHQPVKEEVLLEAEVAKDPEMSIDQFAELLKEKVGDKYNLLGIGQYLAKLESEKEVPIQRIMKQALNPALTEKFCKGLKLWHDSISDSEEAIEKS